MTAAERLDEIDGVTSRATPGPWIVTSESAHYSGLVSASVPRTAWDEGYGGRLVAESVSDNNRKFIAAARTDVPALVAALRAVLAQHAPVATPYGHVCDECGGTYPCETVLLVDANLGGAS